MGRETLSNLFRECSAKDKKVLTLYLTAGYPTLKDTVSLILRSVEEGADIIELGVPFSDPIADGPVIQKTSAIALSNGINLKEIFEVVEKIKENLNVPILLMGYYNPFLKYGEKKLFADAYSSGVDGFIIPDLPPEEGREFYLKCIELDFATVLFLSPLTPPDRISLINELTSGFVYFISMTGITGSKIKSIKNVSAKAKGFRKYLSHPLLIGFGISTPREAKELCKGSDGVIVGSAFLKRVEEEGIESAVRLVGDIKKSL